MKANEYQYQLSKIYLNGVQYQYGLNVDQYLKMQQEYSTLKAAEDTFESNYAFKKSFFIVSQCVLKAINDGLNYFQFGIESKYIGNLMCLVNMPNRNFYDRGGLAHINFSANRIFKKYN